MAAIKVTPSQHYKTFAQHIIPVSVSRTQLLPSTMFRSEMLELNANKRDFFLVPNAWYPYSKEPSGRGCNHFFLEPPYLTLLVIGWELDTTPSGRASLLSDNSSDSSLQIKAFACLAESRFWRFRAKEKLLPIGPPGCWALESGGTWEDSWIIF